MKRVIDIKKEPFSWSRSIEELKRTVEMWITTCPNGEWELELKKKVHQRGVSQNALLWVWMDILSKEWADATDQYYTKEQWKEFFAREFLPVTGPDGKTIGGSTSALTTEQMTEFLTKVQAYAANELGITLLGAEDQMFNEWRSQYE